MRSIAYPGTMTKMERAGAEARAAIADLIEGRGVQTMTMPTDAASPTPIHRALDRLTASKLELQVLRRQLQSGESLDPESMAAQLVQIDGWLDEIATVLSEEREKHSGDNST